MAVNDGTAVPAGETTEETIARIEAADRPIRERGEPGLDHIMGRDRSLESISISLRRIADALELQKPRHDRELEIKYTNPLVRPTGEAP